MENTSAAELRFLANEARRIAAENSMPAGPLTVIAPAENLLERGNERPYETQQEVINQSLATIYRAPLGPLRGGS